MIAERVGLLLHCVAKLLPTPSALRCPKKSSRCSLARFFRPLRMLRLAVSATGGTRLRTHSPRPSNPPSLPYTGRAFPVLKSPIISQTRKLFMKVCANWALSLQIFLISSVLVRGLLFTGKNQNDRHAPDEIQGASRKACSRCDTGSTFQTLDEIQRV